MKTLYESISESILDNNIVQNTNDKINKYRHSIDFIKCIIKKYLWEPTDKFSCAHSEHNVGWNKMGFDYFHITNINKQKIQTTYYKGMAQEFVDEFGEKNIFVEFCTTGPYTTLEIIFKCFDDDKNNKSQGDGYRWPSMNIVQIKGKIDATVTISKVLTPEK